MQQLNDKMITVKFRLPRETWDYLKSNSPADMLIGDLLRNIIEDHIAYQRTHTVNPDEITKVPEGMERFYISFKNDTISGIFVMIGQPELKQMFMSNLSYFYIDLFNGKFKWYVEKDCLDDLHVDKEQ